MAANLILGTVQFGLEYGINNHSGKPGTKEVNSILDLAHRNGINLLDTAEAYGNSQEIIGLYHNASPNRFKIITKFSAARTDLSPSLHTRISQNLKTLNADSLYGYMFHNFSDLVTYYPKFKQEIAALKHQGTVENFGVSIYTNEEFEKLLAFEGIDFVQFPFNLLDNRFQRATLIAKAKAKGIAVHTRSVFLQGLFFKDTNTFSSKLQLLVPYLETLKNLINIQGAQLTDVALNYAVQQNDIDFVLIGVDTAEQLQKNISSLQIKTPLSLHKQIDLIQVKESELLNPSNWN